MRSTGMWMRGPGCLSGKGVARLADSGGERKPCAGAGAGSGPLWRLTQGKTCHFLAPERYPRGAGAPKRIISDQASVFIGDALAELLRQWNIKPRLGAIGKHGSVAVTERVIKTLKYEWLRCVPIIKGFNRLTSLCTEFESWYNTWGPHMTLEGLRPDDLSYSRKPETPKRDAKTVPSHIERHVFSDTRLTAYRMKNAA